jgi:hypothetical protein
MSSRSLPADTVVAEIAAPTGLAAGADGPIERAIAMPVISAARTAARTIGSMNR